MRNPLDYKDFISPGSSFNSRASSKKNRRCSTKLSLREISLLPPCSSGRRSDIPNDILVLSATEMMYTLVTGSRFYAPFLTTMAKE